MSSTRDAGAGAAASAVVAAAASIAAALRRAIDTMVRSRDSMTRSFRFATVAVVLALTTAFAAGCGGSSSTDANDLLKETFAGGHTVKSGNLSVALGLKANGL